MVYESISMKVLAIFQLVYVGPTRTQGTWLDDPYILIQGFVAWKLYVSVEIPLTWWIHNFKMQDIVLERNCIRLGHYKLESNQSKVDKMCRRRSSYVILGFCPLFLINNLLYHCFYSIFQSTSGYNDNFYGSIIWYELNILFSNIPKLKWFHFYIISNE